jgi:hypothetical protein
MTLPALLRNRKPRNCDNLGLSLADMSSTPTDLDAILESIRSRITDEVAAAAPPPLPDLPAKPVRLVPAPVVDSTGVTIEALFTAILEPMLRQWLDANLPEICERAAQAEIKRLTGQDSGQS